MLAPLIMILLVVLNLLID